MVMVIGSSHSTLKDTLPTLIKIEKVKNLRLKYISNTVSTHYVWANFIVLERLKLEMTSLLRNKYVISTKNVYFLYYDLLRVIDYQIQVHNTCKMAYREFRIRFWNIHPTSRIRNLQTIRWGFVIVIIKFHAISWNIPKIQKSLRSNKVVRIL